jgi:hypothetical protein
MLIVVFKGLGQMTNWITGLKDSDSKGAIKKKKKEVD